MATHPYVLILGDRDALEVMKQTAERLQTLTSNWDAATFERSWAPGKWTARQILAHLADCEIAFGFRIRQTLAEDNHTVQPFDQDLWAANYNAYSAEAALACFLGLRAWNNALLRSLPPDAWQRTLNHPERGLMTLETFIKQIGGHDLNHMKQFESLSTAAAAN